MINAAMGAKLLGVRHWVSADSSPETAGGSCPQARRAGDVKAEARRGRATRGAWTSTSTGA
jgi:hypothetical protein